MKCNRCVKHCPVGAKYFDDPNYLYHKSELEDLYSWPRKTPELFLVTPPPTAQNETERAYGSLRFVFLGGGYSATVWQNRMSTAAIWAREALPWGPQTVVLKTQHQALGVGPGQGLLGIGADGAGIHKAGQVGPLADVVTLVGRIPVQDHRQLLPGDVVPGGKLGVADAVDDAVLGGPGHGVGVPGAGFHIREPAVPAGRRLAGQAVEDGHQLGPGGLAVGGEQAHPHPVHEAVLIGVGHCVIEPIALGHVGEGEVRGLALEEGDLHRHLAVGHDEGVGAVGLLVHGHGLSQSGR